MSTPITRANLEILLDSGKIEVAMSNGNWWQIRRNGATKKWKTRPSEFCIPFKTGLRSHGYITDGDMRTVADAEVLNPALFRVKQ